MKSILLTFAMLLSSSAFAETFEVTGMSCSSCVKRIQSKLCAKGGFAKCDVQIGQLTVEAKPGQKIDVAQLRKQITDIGEDYQLGEEIKPAKTTN